MRETDSETTAKANTNAPARVVEESFRPFSQRDDIFCRSFWDPAVRSERSQLFYQTYRTPLENLREVDGYTQRD
jgi:hypothetical protein